MIEQIEKALLQVFATHDLAGLAVGVVKDQTILYVNGFGVMEITTRQPVTSASLFHLASISKCVVATAVMQLTEQGKVDLNAPAASYLPHFQMNDKRYQSVTVRQMLNHTGGMPDYEDHQWDRAEYDDGALERYVRSLGSERLIFEPGKQFAYSNLAYDVLGELVTKVSGQSFEAYVEEHIFQPLEMNTSTFLKQQVPPALGTSPHVSVPRTEFSPIYPYHRAHAPSSSMHSSALEMCHWAIANLNRGCFKNRCILSAASYGQLWHPYAPLDSGAEAAQDFVGLGWFIGDYKGHRSLSHDGGDIGFCTNLVCLPEQGLWVIVLANTYPAPTDTITAMILDILLGLEPQIPRPPVLLPLYPILKARGVEAALAACRDLEAEQAAYDFNALQFSETGYILGEMGRFEEAIPILSLGVALYPKVERLHYVLAWAYQQTGQKRQAAESARRCLEVNPGYWEAERLLEELG